MATYPNMRSLLVLDPRWLTTPKAQAWRRCVLDQKDVTIDRAKRAVKMRFASLAPADAQEAIGWDRQIERSPTDTNASYAARLRDAWNLWQWGGTPFGLLTALADTGYPGAMIQIVNGKSFWLYDAILITRAGTGLATVTVVGQSIPATAMTVSLTVTNPWRGGLHVALVEDSTSIGSMSFTPGTTFDLGGLDSQLAGVMVTIGTGYNVGDLIRFRVGPDASQIGLVTEALPAGSWACDATRFMWNKFVVLFPQNPWGWSAPWWGWPDWIRPDSNDPRIGQLRRIIKRWKSGKAICSAITVINSGNVWGYPQRAWGQSGATWGGNDIMTYSP